MLSTALTALMLYTTYQPDRQETFTSTGVLGTLQRNQGILSDVETRATQVAPYLRNLIALSTALQQKYQAAPLESKTSLRVLLVSDIHAGNQYDLMRTIVQEEGVDVVVDAGDLVNFGTVEEGDATGPTPGTERSRALLRASSRLSAMAWRLMVSKRRISALSQVRWSSRQARAVGSSSSFSRVFAEE